MESITHRLTCFYVYHPCCVYTPHFVSVRETQEAKQSRNKRSYETVLPIYNKMRNLQHRCLSSADNIGISEEYVTDIVIY